MPGITLAVLNDMELAAELGKKGTTSDIQMYNYRVSGKDLTVAYPLRYPDRLQSLLYALDMCDIPVIAVKEFSATLGEEIVAISRFGFSSGTVILEDPSLMETWKRIVKSTPLSRFEVAEKSIPHLLERFASLQPVKKSDFDHICIDHFFNVKGVGTVILGVSRGKVHRHDKFRLFPTDKVVEIKSIQVHDVDVEEAENGDRVGLAIKGAEVDELERGFVLAAPDALHVTRKIEMAGEMERYYKGTHENITHLFVRLSLIPVKVRVVGGTGEKFVAEVELQKPAALNPGDSLILVDLNGKGLRIACSGKVEQIL
ncbi:MAG: EF-Tu/IF-2/RF-3 family GTPase [Thermoplasmata archaeon]|nr:EF-Tu/IF-2/RF-3 family GTPase [Thermoplasmata archaeon]